MFDGEMEVSVEGTNVGLAQLSLIHASLPEYLAIWGTLSETMAFLVDILRMFMILCLMAKWK